MDNENAESLPADAVVESSPTEQVTPVAPAETPAKQVEQEREVPFNEHPRWQERQRELEELRRQNSELLEIAKRVTTPQVPQVDHYAGLDDETKKFYQKQEEMARRVAEEVAAKAKAEVSKELEESRMLSASLIYERFLQQNPDIKKGSQEEARVVDYYKRGYTLEDAADLVRLPRIKDELKRTTQQKQIQKVQEKVAANLETDTLAPKSGLPEKKGKFNVREFMEANWGKI